MRIILLFLNLSLLLLAHGNGAPAEASGLHTIHPPFTHFAVALPLAAFVVAGYQLWRLKALDSSELLLFCLSVLGVAAAAVTGSVAHEAVEASPVSDAAMMWLHRHEDLGTGLALYFLLLPAYRFRLHIRPPGGPAGYRPYLLLLFLGVAALFAQGAIGGMMVYEFGIGTPGKM